MTYVDLFSEVLKVTEPGMEMEPVPGLRDEHLESTAFASPFTLGRLAPQFWEVFEPEKIHGASGAVR